MPTLHVHISADAYARLLHEHSISGRSPTELAANAVEEAALRAAPEIKADAALLRQYGEH